MCGFRRRCRALQSTARMRQTAHTIRDGCVGSNLGNGMYQVHHNNSPNICQRGGHRGHLQGDSPHTREKARSEMDHATHSHRAQSTVHARRGTCSVWPQSTGYMYRVRALHCQGAGCANYCRAVYFGLDARCKDGFAHSSTWNKYMQQTSNTSA